MEYCNVSDTKEQKGFCQILAWIYVCFVKVHVCYLWNSAKLKVALQD